VVPDGTVTLSWFEAEEGHLPPLCLRCGKAARSYRPGTVNWIPAWLYLLLPAFIAPFIVGFLLFRKRVRILGPFCEKHRSYWAHKRMVLFAFLFLLPVAALYLLFFSLAFLLVGPGAAFGISFVGFWIWLVFFLRSRFRMTRAIHVTDEGVTLAGVAEEFVRQIEKERGAAARLWLAGRERTQST
jgi:hypothetical protein